MKLYLKLSLVLTFIFVSISPLRAQYSAHFTLDTFNVLSIFDKSMSIEKAKKIEVFFRNNEVFRRTWVNARNNCEDRANAISMLLNSWNIKHCKVWLFNHKFPPSKAKLEKSWLYHVAVAILVNETELMVIDPATLNELEKVQMWATINTDTLTSQYLYTSGHCYVFSNRDSLQKVNWNMRNTKNFKYTMQGLAGYNNRNIWRSFKMIFHTRRVNKIKKAYLSIEKPNLN